MIDWSRHRAKKNVTQKTTKINNTDPTTKTTGMNFNARKVLAVPVFYNKSVVLRIGKYGKWIVGDRVKNKNTIKRSIVIWEIEIS
jgi:hypothetical protein